MGRRVLISGSTSGLGLDLAIQLCRLGHSVAVNGRSHERVDAAASAVREAVEGAEVTTAACDITDSRAVDEMVAGVRDELGPIDMFVHAAVTRNEKSLVETTDEVWEDNLATCLDGAFYCTRAVLPGMIERRWGRIVYYGGIVNDLGLAGRAALVVAKNGLYGLTKAVASEVGQYNITVNAVSPGVVEDRPLEMPDNARTEKRTALIGTSRLERFGTTREINAATLFLLSDEASYVTAQRLSVSGGMSAC